MCQSNNVYILFKDFINFTNLNTNALSASFSQPTKNRSSHIIGLEWILNSQILYVTNQVFIKLAVCCYSKVAFIQFLQGLELYQVNPEKKSVKLLKSYNISLYWYLYYVSSIASIYFNFD